MLTASIHIGQHGFRLVSSPASQLDGPGSIPGPDKGLSLGPTWLSEEITTAQ